MLNTKKIKKDFPIFVSHPKLVYLDSSATSQKPQSVIDAISDFYKNSNANIHRGIYDLSEKATEIYEQSRQKVANFINANSSSEIIFSKNTTEAINLVAQSYGSTNLKAGDEVLVSNAEHHSNYLPWEKICQETGASFKVVETSSIEKEINKKTKIVAIAHASNVLGTLNDIKQITKIAHQNGAIVVVDGAQAVPHIAVDMQDLDCDFYAFSGHKMLAAMGIGVLFAKEKHLANMPPYQTGGGMITMKAPAKFEAGTPNVAGAVSLTKAIDYLSEIGMENIEKHEQEMTNYLLKKLEDFKELKVIKNDSQKRLGLISFYSTKVHAHDIAEFLAKDNIAVRAGYHCANPLHKNNKWPATVRASYYFYNDLADIDSFLVSLKKALDYYG